MRATLISGGFALMALGGDVRERGRAALAAQRVVTHVLPVGGRKRVCRS